jgi:lipoyl(octanoyl) transferase
MELVVQWLGRLEYRAAWERQLELVAARDAGTASDTLLLVEHDPVLTLGRNALPEHVLATDDELKRRGIEVIRVERGGEVTYHGPGQLVAYPIVRLRERGVLLRPLVRALEGAMADTAEAYGVEATARAGYPGIWVDVDGPNPRKLGALGLRVEKGITFHGIALNITTRLGDFGLIEPCGMAGLDVTSIVRELGLGGRAAEPTTESVRTAADRFAAAFKLRLAAAASDSPTSAPSAAA